MDLLCVDGLSCSGFHPLQVAQAGDEAVKLWQSVQRWHFNYYFLLSLVSVDAGPDIVDLDLRHPVDPPIRNSVDLGLQFSKLSFAGLKFIICK